MTPLRFVVGVLKASPVASFNEIDEAIAYAVARWAGEGRRRTWLVVDSATLSDVRALARLHDMSAVALLRPARGAASVELVC